MDMTAQSSHGGGRTSRRSFLVALPALAMVPRVAAQSRQPSIAARTVNHLTLTVSDIQRSLEFYEGLFGMWNYAPDDALPRLRIGSGPASLGLRQGVPQDTGGLGHLCLGVDGFDADEILEVLAVHGVARVEAAGTAPMTAWMTMRAETPEVFLVDPNGILVQLQDVSYCGGSGTLGDTCPPQPREHMMQPSRAPVRLHTINHVIVAAADPVRTEEFWGGLFPSLVGPVGPPFLRFVRATDAAPRLDHICFGLENFQAEEIMRRLLEFGIREQIGGRGYALKGPPLRARAFARSGAPDGSNSAVIVEVYVTDPDNIMLQLNDVNYMPV